MEWYYFKGDEQRHGEIKAEVLHLLYLNVWYSFELFGFEF